MNSTTIPERVALIRSERVEKRLSIKRLADLAGLTPSTIQDMDTEAWNPTLKTLTAIERALAGDPVEEAPTIAAE